MSTAQQDTKNHPRKATAPYINNPFFIATEGISLFFTKAKNVAILLLILSAVAANASFFSGPQHFAGNPSTPVTAPQSTQINTPASQPTPAPAQSAPDLPPVAIGLLIVLPLVAIAIIASVITIAVIASAMLAYTAAETAKGRAVGIKQAFHAVIPRFWGFVWLQLLIGIKVLLWTLLLVVPGIIMAVRYSLASVSFFDSDKKLKGDAAIKDSVQLTKGAWLTTFSSQLLFNIITGGVVQLLADGGTKAVLYRQFEAARISNTPKPRPHGLAWATLALAIILALALLALTAWSAYNYATSTPTA
jgi:hypothetical protein